MALCRNDKENCTTSSYNELSLHSWSHRVPTALVSHAYGVWSVTLFLNIPTALDPLRLPIRARWAGVHGLERRSLTLRPSVGYNDATSQISCGSAQNCHRAQGTKNTLTDRQTDRYFSFIRCQHVPVSTIKTYVILTSHCLLAARQLCPLITRLLRQFWRKKSDPSRCKHGLTQPISFSIERKT